MLKNLRPVSTSTSLSLGPGQSPYPGPVRTVYMPWFLPGMSIFSVALSQRTLHDSDMQGSKLTRGQRESSSARLPQSWCCNTASSRPVLKHEARRSVPSGHLSASSRVESPNFSRLRVRYPFSPLDLLPEEPVFHYRKSSCREERVDCFLSAAWRLGFL